MSRKNGESGEVLPEWPWKLSARRPIALQMRSRT
jgi:hypothetical protein